MTLVKDLDDIHVALTKAWALAQRAGLKQVLAALEIALAEVEHVKSNKLRPPSWDVRPTLARHPE